MDLIIVAYFSVNVLSNDDWWFKYFFSFSKPYTYNTQILNASIICDGRE